MREDSQRRWSRTNVNFKKKCTYISLLCYSEFRGAAAGKRENWGQTERRWEQKVRGGSQRRHVSWKSDHYGHSLQSYLVTDLKWWVWRWRHKTRENPKSWHLLFLLSLFTIQRMHCVFPAVLRKADMFFHSWFITQASAWKPDQSTSSCLFVLTNRTAPPHPPTIQTCSLSGWTNHSQLSATGRVLTLHCDKQPRWLMGCWQY